MYSVTLNVCAYILLLSSVYHMILLRKQFKQWKGTPLYILSISDVLFSMFTSSILFINCVVHITYINHNKVNNTFSTNDSMWDIEDINGNQQIKLKKFIEKLNTITNQNNFDIILKCNIISIIMKYGILFFPFVNSFVSLLIFSVQYNLSVFQLKHQCLTFLQSQETIYEDNTGTNKFNTGAQFDPIVKPVKLKKIAMLKQNMKNILHMFKCNNKVKRDKKMAIIFVLSQWIVPIFVTVLLYMSVYNDTNTIRDWDNVKCFTESVFLLDDCYNNIKPINMSQNVNFETYTIPLYNDYTNDYTSNEDLVKLQNFNVTQVNEIISKVQNLVFSAMNDTLTASPNTNSYNISKLSNIIKYLELDSYANIIEQNKSIENKPNLMKDTLIKYENSNNLVNIGNDTNLQSSVQLSNYNDKDNEELLLFDYLMINSSKDILEKENYDKKNTANTTENLYFKKLPADVTEKKSNDQIYNEILKRIHNIPQQNYYKHKNYYNKKQPKEFKTEVIQPNSALDKQNILSDIKNIIYQNDNTLKIMQAYVIDECFISIQFLKLHLLALLFVIYFLPILFSSILQQHGKLNCQIILEKLKTTNKILLNNFDSDFINEMSNACCDVSMDSKGPSTSKQDFKYLNENLQGSVNFNKSQLIQTNQEDYNIKLNKHYKRNQHVSFNEKKIQLNMINEIENMLQLFNIIKMSLLCGILLWTPLFFEFLTKVFTILYIPEWLLNMTYLAGIAFNTLRNIFNLKMIKLQQKVTNTTKINSIQPTIYES